MAVAKYLQKFNIKINELWFIKEEDQGINDCDIFMYAGMANPPEGYGKNILVRHGKTLINDLRMSEDELLKEVNGNTRAKIKKAEKEELSIEFYDSGFIKQNPYILDDFIEYYNAFVDSTKGSAGLEKKNMVIYKAYLDAEILAITCAKYKGERIIYHAYLMNGNYVRLNASASVFRNFDEEQQKINNLANCLLHWRDMMPFKKLGYERFDWGGYSDLESLRGINQFKRGFGGGLADIYAYSIPHTILGSAVVFLLRIREQIQERREHEA